jgi:hypothetical protein
MDSGGWAMQLLSGTVKVAGFGQGNELLQLLEFIDIQSISETKFLILDINFTPA